MTDKRRQSRLSLPHDASVTASPVTKNVVNPKASQSKPLTQGSPSKTCQEQKPTGAVKNIPRRPGYQDPKPEKPKPAPVARKLSAIPTSMKSALGSKLPTPSKASTEKPKLSQSPPPKSPTQKTGGSQPQSPSYPYHLPPPVYTRRGDEIAVSWRTREISLHEVMRAINADIDKSPARVNQRAGSKLVIGLETPYGVRKAETYDTPIDWSDLKLVDGLNRWRAAIFNYYFGDETEVDEVQPHPLEEAFVAEEYAKLQTAGLTSWPTVGKNLPSWARIARDFNAKFEGRILEGDQRPRPRVTWNVLRARYLVSLQRSQEQKEWRDSIDRASTLESVDPEASSIDSISTPATVSSSPRSKGI